MELHTKITASVVSTIFLALVISATSYAFTTNSKNENSYELTFFDDFKANKLDTASWSIIRRNTCSWGKYMSSNRSLIQCKSGYIRLYARYNQGLERNDTAHYLTGGISSEGKHTVEYGKVEVRARFHGATASWPAIWLFRSGPAKKEVDSEYSEIDILEYPNRESYALQTVHNYYTMKLRKTENPPHQFRPEIDPEVFNVYAVEITPEAVIFSINGEETFRYPNLKEKTAGQFPFGCKSYLMLDMQVGAGWLPKPDKKTFPAYMDIDWVKIYKKK